jgi:hypothetical protein
LAVALAIIRTAIDIGTPDSHWVMLALIEVA